MSGRRNVKPKGPVSKQPAKGKKNTKRVSILDFRKPMFEKTAKFIREFVSLMLMAGGFAALATINNRWELHVFGMACFLAMWMITHDYTSQIATVKTLIEMLPFRWRLTADIAVISGIIAINSMIFMTGTEAIRLIALNRMSS